MSKDAGQGEELVKRVVCAAVGPGDALVLKFECYLALLANLVEAAVQHVLMYMIRTS